MNYVTALSSPQGNHGHRLNEQISAVLLSNLIGAQYYHTSNTTNDITRFTGIHNCSAELPNNIKKILIPGQSNLKKGMDSSTLDMIANINNKEKSVLFILDSRKAEKALNLYAHQITDKYVVKKTMQQLEDSFLLENPNDIFREEINVHINRGIDWFNKRLHENMKSSQYQFPISYWINLIDSINGQNSKNLDINIFTETLASEETVERLGCMKNVKMHLGPNRKDGRTAHSCPPQDIIANIWRRFVTGSHMVASNSTFGTSSFWFRGNRPFLYHEHCRLKELPKNCSKINFYGGISQERLFIQ
jgi:hypothetical protein